MSDETTKNETGALQRGLAIVDTLLAAERSLTLNEIADRTGLSSATAHRLLTTLVQTGHISRNATKHYLPSMRAALPISQYHPLNALRRTAGDKLRALRNTFGLTAFFVIYVGPDRYILELIPGTDPFTPLYQAKLDTPLHGGVTGKILLALSDADERTRLLGPEPYHAAAPQTIITRKELDEELARVASQRYAETRQEVYDGMWAIGAPIVAEDTLFGAIVLSGPLDFVDSGRRQDALQQTMRAADLFSHASPDVRQVARFFGA